MSNTLFLRLEGPLQAWGERGRWSVRDTASEPTKSGVIGLIACALGYADDKRIQSLSQKTRMGVRVDAPGRIISDYHTIGGGYDYPTLLTAQGKPKKTPKGQPHTEISQREYLCDASFLVALQVKNITNSELISQMAIALQNPVWPFYLGRKACVPSTPVFVGMGSYENLEDALVQKSFTKYAQRELNQPFSLRMILETDKAIGRRHRDNIYSRRYRVFHPRYTIDEKKNFITLREEDGNVSLQIATEQS